MRRAWPRARRRYSNSKEARSSGFSGAPLLNRRTGAVCGIIRRTRNEETDLGGYAIPVKDFETCKFYRNLRRFISLAGGADPHGWIC